LEREQKLKVKLQDRNSDNSQVLAELQVARQKINNMEKHKDLENIRMERDYLHATLKEIDGNYLNLKAKKDTLSVEHNKLHTNYKNMEWTLLKQQKELEELIVDIGNVYQANSEVQRQFDQRHA
jgi:chromosome segregation ATPase